MIAYKRWQMGLAVTTFFILLLLSMYLLSAILTPFLAGALLAYLCDPLVNRLTVWRLSRIWAVTLVFLLILFILVALTLYLIPMIEDEVVAVAAAIPHQLDYLQQQALPWLMTHLNISKEQITNASSVKTMVANNLSKVGNVSTWTIKTALYSGKRLIEWMVNLLLIFIVTFYLLRDWPRVIKSVHGLIPRSIEPKVSQIVGECNTVLGAFFRGQLLVMLSLSIMYAVLLSLLGLQAAILIGFIIGIASIVPYLGAIIGFALSVGAAFIQFKAWMPIVWVVVIFSAGHVIDNAFLTPKLVGGRVGLHPVAVIFSILVGGKLFGFFGVLLALPVAAILVVLLRHVNAYYRQTSFYREHE